MKNNLDEIILKLKPKEENSLAHPLPVRRRVISHGLRDRGSRFAPTIRGEDFMQGGSLLDSSGVISLGKDLPSPAELARKEEEKKILEEVQKHPGSIPIPKKRDRFKK